MKYYIKRDLNEYGPYTLADLQRYVAQGNISPNDLTRSEGMTDWVPVSQAVGTIAVAAPPPAVPAAAPGGTVYSGSLAAPALAPAGVQAYGPPVGQAVPGPIPPDLHWALVLVFGMVSCGLFNLVWIFIEAGFVKKIRPASNHLALIIAGTAVQFGSVIVFYASVIGLAASSAGRGSNEPPAGPLMVLLALYWVGLLGGAVLLIIGNFKIRSAMVEYYNTVEPINLRLSAVLTFFFPIFYFQYHLSRIAVWKRTGYLMPQVYQG